MFELRQRLVRGGSGSRPAQVAVLVLSAAVALRLAVRPFSLVYSATRPPMAVLVSATALGSTGILLTAGLTLRFLRTSRKSLDPSTYPQSPHKVMVATRGRFDGPVTLTLLIPAHNEAARLGATLASLDAQTRRPERVIVVADNCTDTSGLTEDNELTIALRTMGGLMVSPSDCTVVTALMPTLPELWRQRLRWQRGAVENIGAYGLNKATFRYWAQQLAIGYGTVALLAYLTCMAILIGASDTWVWFPFWMGVGSVFAVERVVTAWAAGRVGRLVPLALIPELLYDSTGHLRRGGVRGTPAGGNGPRRGSPRGVPGRQ